MEFNNKRLERQTEVERLCAKFSLTTLRAGGALLKAFENDYVQTPLSKEEIDAIHEKGFSALHWLTLDLDDEKCKEYMSTVDYYRYHPYNGDYSMWIDDKLTLKYICAGTKLAKYLPDYYFQIDKNGNVLPLPDCEEKLRNSGFLGIIETLDDKKCLAIKSIKGDSGTGFYKAEKTGEGYLLNGKLFSSKEFISELEKLRGYIVTEYLRQHEYFNGWSVGATCGVRYLAGRVNSRLVRLDSFIRFGTKSSNFVDNLHAGGFVCFIDRNGNLGTRGYLFDKTSCRVSDIDRHPDTQKLLIGKIPMWNEIEEAVADFSDWFPQLKYLGFDFVVTDDCKIKVLEINSLSGIDVSQFDIPAREKGMMNFFETFGND